MNNLRQREVELAFGQDHVFTMAATAVILPTLATHLIKTARIITGTSTPCGKIISVVFTRRNNAPG